MEGMREACRLGEEAASYVTETTFRDYREIVLEFELVSWPYLIWETKKRYAARIFESADGAPSIYLKGVECARRDNAVLLRDAYYRLVETMMPLEGDAIPKAEMAERLRAVLADEVLKPLMENGLPMEKYVISKSLKRRYKSDTVTQKRLADKIVARIERKEMVCNPPKSGDRIPYVIRQGPEKIYERGEDPEYAKEHGIKVDRLYYLDNQLRNSMLRLTQYFFDAKPMLDACAAELERQRLGQRRLTSFSAKVGESVDSSVFLSKRKTGSTPASVPAKKPRTLVAAKGAPSTASTAAPTKKTKKRQPRSLLRF